MHRLQELRKENFQNRKQLWAASTFLSEIRYGWKFDFCLILQIPVNSTWGCRPTTRCKPGTKKGPNMVPCIVCKSWGQKTFKTVRNFGQQVRSFGDQVRLEIRLAQFYKFRSTPHEAAAQRPDASPGQKSARKWSHASFARAEDTKRSKPSATLGGKYVLSEIRYGRKFNFCSIL